MPVCQAQGEIRLDRLKAEFPLLFLPLFLSCLYHGCAHRSVGLPPQRKPGIYHVVKSGENLFRIGKAYDVPYQDLARINYVEDPHRIRAGQKIYIPGATRQLPVEIITPSDAAPGRPPLSDLAVGVDGRFVWPIAGDVTSRFGPRGDSFHDGVDISASEGTQIRASERGEVMYSDQLRAYGNLIVVRHPGGFVSVYAHNRKNLVQEGQTVTQGEVIGEVGQTGRVSAPHLHFEIRKDNVARDPLYYLPRL